MRRWQEQNGRQNIVGKRVILLTYSNKLVSKVNDNKKYNGFGYIGCNGYVPCQVCIHNKYLTCKRVQQIVQKFRNALGWCQLFHARARFLLENCNNLVLIPHLCKLFTIFLSCFQTGYLAKIRFMQTK